VREGVGELGEEARLVEELGILQVGEAQAEWHLGDFGYGLEQCYGHLGADDGRGLQERFFLGRQPVEARRQQRLHHRWYLNRWECFGQAIGPPLTDQHLGFHQGPDTLLQQKGVALGVRDQAGFQRFQTGVPPQEALQQDLGPRVQQGIEAELGVIGLRPPPVPVPGAIVEQEEQAGSEQTFHQAVKARLGLGVDPV
jgi:hypothetical protein